MGQWYLHRDTHTAVVYLKPSGRCSTLLKILILNDQVNLSSKETIWIITNLFKPQLFLLESLTWRLGKNMLRKKNAPLVENQSIPTACPESNSTEFTFFGVKGCADTA